MCDSVEMDLFMFLFSELCGVVLKYIELHYAQILSLLKWELR
jgi:hypothetical protein